MTNFRDFGLGLNQSEMENPSVKISLKSSSHILYFKFDSKDILVRATYLGSADPWVGSLCSIAQGQSLHQLSTFSMKNWIEAFEHDQTFWDLKSEKDDLFFFSPLELLQAGIDSYRGREYLYQEADPLICRCYGVRENDVLEYVRSTDDPTPEGLATVTKAGMGCRSCVTQLTKWLSIQKPKSQNHFYKEKSRARWLLEIDYMLSCFPEASDWKMEVKSFQGTQVMIQFDRDVSQIEEESISLRLQDFLSAGLDADLSFFLIRA